MKKFKMNTIAAVAAATMLSFGVAAPAHATNSDKCANSFFGLAKQSCVEQVNLEDMRVKSGDVSGDTLTLRVEDQAATRGRPIYGKDVYIDVSGLNQADDVATNATNINSQGDRITVNEGDIEVLKNQVFNVGANSIDIQGDRITVNEGDIDTNTTNIDTNTTNITDNRTDIDTNTTNITDNRTDIDTNTTNIDTNTTNITDNRTDIDINRTDIDSQGDRITVNEGDIDTNTTNIDINRTDIDSQGDRITVNEGDIDINTTAISRVHEKANTNMQNIAAANQRIDNVISDMRYMDRNLSAGIASAMAIGQHQFDPSYSGGQVSLAGGVFNGENAVSFAVGVPLGNQAFFSASIATDSGSYGESGSVGITYRLPK